ncbi:MAG: ABC transporter substrate-binding protein, partial [Candidatus Zixiibacteriota bacterium]
IGALNPEVIIDLVAEDRSDSGRVFIMSQWFSLSGVRAVRERRVFVFYGARLVTPGPRFVTLIDDFMRALHPELYPED